MNQLQAIPTTHGLSILTSSLKSTIKQFKLLGNIGPESADVYEFYSSTIHASYYDENGVLTFEMRLPTETHFDEYMYKVHIVDDASAVVIECDTPKIALPKGIGGMLTLKSTVTGSPGDLVFQNSDFFTETEFMARFASKMQAMPYDPYRTYSTGETCYTKDAHTGELSYWQWYSNVEMLSGKDPLDSNNRFTNWSDTTKPPYWVPHVSGEIGSTVWFGGTIPPETMLVENNQDVPKAVYWRLAAKRPELVVGNVVQLRESQGRYLRAADGAEYVVGQTHEDAIRNLKGGVSSVYSPIKMDSGVLELKEYGSSPAKVGVIGADPGGNRSIEFDASKMVPTANQNQPVTMIEWKGLVI
ncbi:hypothetical protein VCRA2126O85_10388 [Vibrio crassostreae]|nr:hypothetical protein VCRA2126O84_10046 [Vibrio crassostreae]CAK2692676.1 hypothetical protein VCRA2127O91_10046 [Vibrio crassostreae]CAK2724816.1 hypothetical protein VCRA2128O100_10388 [Vibrio crassostreae]CAK2727899.1 hypothetical protein VCRA2125O83_10388 [Vibrio crassostreae]CAK2727977.1 hypothetical protein VCRA2128O106_10388 [Vibrio crassostreae]